ncbi:hypothetical protein TNCV_5043021 [Trichonephila clavipes]|nr:hypothetical protein TNCV_5043021 [Trichonephila clavipes]
MIPREATNPAFNLQGRYWIDLAILNLGHVTRTSPELTPLLQTTTTGGLRGRKIKYNQPPALGGSSVAPGLEPATPRSRICDYNH